MILFYLENRRVLNGFMLMVVVVKAELKLCDATITCVSVKKLHSPWRIKTLNEETRKKKWMSSRRKYNEANEKKNWKKNVGVRQGVKNQNQLFGQNWCQNAVSQQSLFSTDSSIAKLKNGSFFGYFQCFPEISELLQKNRNRNLQFFSIKKQFEEIIWVSNWKRMQSRTRV